jgi:hypothetical protein
MLCSTDGEAGGKKETTMTGRPIFPRDTLFAGTGSNSSWKVGRVRLQVLPSQSFSLPLDSAVSNSVNQRLIVRQDRYGHTDFGLSSLWRSARSMGPLYDKLYTVSLYIINDGLNV